MKLYMIRHGIAMERDQWQDDDLKRPLTGQGIKKTKKAMKALVQLDLIPDVILSSCAERAWKTGDIYKEQIALEKGSKSHTVFWQSELLNPGAEPEEILRALKEARDKRLSQRLISHLTIAITGHEPDISDLVEYLFQNPDAGKYLDGVLDELPRPAGNPVSVPVVVKKASFIEMDADSEFGTKLIQLIQPSVLRQAARN